jgi:predicted RNase H-like nuclease (RuvC/YqgF family)
MSNVNTPDVLAHSMAESLMRENKALRAEVASLKEENARLKAMPLASDSVRAAIYGEAIDRLNAQIAGNVSEIFDLTQQLAAANGRVEMLEDSLRLILPLAKGYVAHNNVGSNRKYIEIAEATLSNLNEDSAG